MLSGQQRSIFLTEKSLACSQTFLILAISIHKMDHFSVADGELGDPVGSGTLKPGPGTIRLTHSQRKEGITYPGHWQMAP